MADASTRGNGRPHRGAAPAPIRLLVQGRGRLPAARQGVLRLERRRHRRFPGTHREARLRQGSRRQHDLAAAVLPVAAARRRLRRRGLPERAPVLRHARRLPAVRARGASPRAARHHRAHRQPHVRPAPVVPGGAPRAQGLAEAQLLRLERRSRQVRRHPHHLHRHREVELGVGRRREGLLLAPLLQSPAGPQLRQPAGAQGDLPRDALLARHGGRRLPPRRDSVPVRARGHQQREPARNPRRAEGAARARRRALPERAAAGRGEPVAGGRARVFRRRATSATWRITSR